MERYAHEENIRRFEHELQRENDPQRRTTLERLLNEERIHLERLRREQQHAP